MRRLIRTRRALLVVVLPVVMLGTAVAAGAISQVHLAKPPIKSFSYSSLTDSRSTNYPPYDSPRTDIITVDDLTLQAVCPQRGSSADAYLIFTRGKADGTAYGEYFDLGQDSPIARPLVVYLIAGNPNLNYIHAQSFGGDGQVGEDILTGQFVFHSVKTNDSITVHFSLISDYNAAYNVTDSGRCSLYGTTG